MGETLTTAPAAPTSEQEYKGFDDEPVTETAQPYEGFGFNDSEPAKTESMGFEPTIGETLDAVDAQEKASKQKSFRQKVGSLFTKRVVKNPQSSVGDLAHSLEDTGKLSDYKSGLENLQDRSDKPGVYDEQRESVLGSLHDEANAENALVDHAAPLAEAQKAILDAKPEDVEGLSREAVASFQDKEMGKLAQTAEQSGSDADKALVKSWLAGANYKDHINVDDIRAKREEILQRDLSGKQEATLAAAQSAAIQQRYQQ